MSHPDPSFNPENSLENDILPSEEGRVALKDREDFDEYDDRQDNMTCLDNPIL